MGGVRRADEALTSPPRAGEARAGRPPMNIRLVGKVVCAALVSLAMGGVLACTLDNKKIEDSIKTTIKEKGITMKSVSCPTGQKSSVGSKFECTGETEDGGKLKFQVEVTGSDGSIKWELEGKILDMSKIGDSIEKKVHESADVKCPEKSLVVKKGDVVDCTVEIEGKKQKLQIKAIDNDGNIKWELKGAAKGDDDDDDDSDKKTKKKKADDDDDDDKKTKKKKAAADDDDDD
jgi:hypothetical protein